MVSGNAPPSLDGVGDATCGLIRALVELRPGWEWFWIARRPRWFHSPWVPDRGFRLIRPHHGWGETGKRLTSGLVRWLRPSIVHIQDQIHSFHESDAAVRIAMAAPCPVVTTLHEYHVELPSVRYTDALVNASTIVIANDARTADRCADRTRREPDYRWWSGSGIPPIDPNVDVKPIPGLVVTFGFLNAVKAMGRAFEALKLARTTRPWVRWRIIGPFEPATNAHHAALVEQIQADWVTFEGRVDSPELRARLGEASVMLLPFEDGASPRRSTLQAAWSCGLPVATTPPTIPEPSIVDGRNALLFREPTAEDWAEGLGRILDNPDLADRLRVGSLEAAEQFGHSRLAELHIALYESLLESRR